MFKLSAMAANFGRSPFPLSSPRPASRGPAAFVRSLRWSRTESAGQTISASRGKEEEGGPRLGGRGDGEG